MNPVITEVSRYEFCEKQVDDSGRLFVDDRKPFRFQVYRDTVFHVVGEGDTLFNLAGRYYSRATRGAGLWWVIADFQPQPIHDPTIRLVPGSVIQIPSLRVVLAEIVSEGRRGESRL